MLVNIGKILTKCQCHCGCQEPSWGENCMLCETKHQSEQSCKCVGRLNSMQKCRCFCHGVSI